MKTLFRAIALVMACGVLSLRGTDFYVSTNGVSSGPGTNILAPWALSYALSHAGISNVINLLPGDYPSIDLDTPSLHQGITLKSPTKWAAKIVGSAAMHGVNTEPGVSNVVLDGLQIAYTYIDGVKFNDHYSTVRNCWIHHCGRGGNQPTNNTGTYSGQGIAAHGKTGTVIEYNLLEDNGVWFGHDHGVYASGTNIVIRGNVARGNASYGIQLYENSPSGTAEARVYNNILVNNGTYSANSGLVLYTYNGQTNYIYNNTIIETNNMALNFSGGVVCLTNNILISSGGSLDQRSLPTTYFADYNLSTSTLDASITGSHDVINSSALSGFVSTNSGLYWLKSTSPARGAATPTIKAATDFWGNTQYRVSDIGAVQYTSSLSSDSRTLYPSGSNGADFWSQLAPPGSLISASIETNGWIARLTFANMDTNGTWSTGFSSNNVPTSSKLSVTVRSQGYNSSGSSVTTNRTLYGTYLLDQPYPNRSLKDTIVSGSDLITRISLSDYVYSGDSNIVINLSSGAYTASSLGNLSASSFAASNISTQGMARVVGNWTYPGHSLITGSTARLRCFVAHRHYTSGQAVPVVRFSLTDGSATNSVDVYAVSKSELPDPVQVLEYIGDVPTTGLSNGVVTANFKAFPFVGDSTSILDTSDGVNTEQSANYASQTYWLQRTGAIPGSIAVVSTTGSDSTGVAVNVGNFVQGSPPAAFATLGRAAQACATNNNTQFGRNDTGLSTVYMQAGNYAWTGFSGSYGSVPATWLTVAPFPGLSTNAVVFTSAGASGAQRHLGGLDKVTGCKWNLSDAIVHDQFTATWIDGCEVNATGAQFVGASSGSSVWYFTHSYVSGLTQQLKQVGNSPLALIRGINLPNYYGTIFCRTAVGNLRTNSVAPTSNTTIQSEIQSQYFPDNIVIAFNKILGGTTSGNPMVSLRKFSGLTHGLIFSQNVIESVDSAGPLMLIAGDSQQAATPVINAIITDNTFVGQRCNINYDDFGSVANPREKTVQLRNLWQDHNIKTDDFVGNSGNGNRIGNWPDVHGVGSVGNVASEITGIGVGNNNNLTFEPRFKGMYTYRPTIGSTNPKGWEQFINLAAYNGTNGIGSGNYLLASSSPIRSLTTSVPYMLPYDIDGSPRTASSPAGAFSDAVQTPALPSTFLFLWKP